MACYLADDPSQGSAARQLPVGEVQAVLERSLNLLDWQELTDNATDTDTVLVRDPTGSLELQKIWIPEASAALSLSWQ